MVFKVPVVPIVQVVQIAALLFGGASEAPAAVKWSAPLRAPALALMDGTTPSLDLASCDRALVYVSVDRLEAELLDLTLEFSPTAGAAWYQGFALPQRTPGDSVYLVDPAGSHLRARWRLIGPHRAAIFGLTVECHTIGTIGTVQAVQVVQIVQAVQGGA
jgi:hypothetical protein